MAINLKNFLNPQNKDSKMGDFQDLEHLDGVSISITSANLYGDSRDDLVMFYFREGANYASVYTKSKIVSENIKWNLNLKSKKISALIVNTRNANTFTGQKGYQGLKEIAEELSIQLSKKQREDEDVKMKEVLDFNSCNDLKSWEQRSFSFQQIQKLVLHLKQKLEDMNAVENTNMVCF